MAKGSLFWGQGRGKLGQVVLSTVKGQQVARTYQATVANPKSSGQMEQRAKFANAVKFYKHSQQNFFKFAFEDKKKTESDYNAFMRHNVVRSCFLNKSVVDNGNFPALAMADEENPAAWMLAQGSLPEVLVDSVDTPNLSLTIEAGKTADNVTVGDFTTAFLEKNPGFIDGDYITFVTVISTISDISGLPSESPIWGIVQLKLDASSATQVKAVFDMEANSDAKRMPSLSVKETVLSFTAPSTPAYPSTMFAVVASRNTKAGLLTSNSYLWANKKLLDIIGASNTYEYQKAALSSWNAQEVVLKGHVYNDWYGG